MDPIAHSFGGSALDRHLYDFDTDDGTGTDVSAGAGLSSETAAPPSGAETGEAVPPAAETDTAPAWTPDQITALRSDPEFRSFMAEEAAAIADARINQLLGSLPPQQQPGQQGGDQVDLNQLLDPMSENFGTNLAAVLGNVVQTINQTLEQRLSPFSQQAEQAQQAELDGVLSTAITDHAQTVGGLKGGPAAIARVAAAVRSVHMPEAARMYGNTDRAAQDAIDKAIRAERAYQDEISGTSATQTAEHLAALNGGRGEISAAAATGVVTLPNVPLSSRERVAKYAPQIQNSRT